MSKAAPEHARDERPTMLTRRSVLIGAGGLSFGILLGPQLSAAVREREHASIELSPWVSLEADGTITIMAAAAELGQGTRTHQPLILAEEMDADWSMVRIVSAPPNDKIYGNPGLGGLMYTNAARTLSGYFPAMRTFGAQIRQVLLANMARHWNVPVAELTTEPSTVVHAVSGRRMKYGSMVEFLELPEKAPEIAPEQLKTPREYRYLGHDIMREDVPAKTRGAALYSIDVQVPGMVYGAVLRAPVEGATPDRVDDARARAVKGVIDIVRLAYGIGVVADKPWSAFTARDALDVTWTRTGKAWGHHSDELASEYMAVAKDLTIAGKSGGERAGDALAAMATAATIVEGEYRSDLAYHAQMEPLSAVASVRSDGDAAEIWVGTQSQTICVDSARMTLGIAPEKIKLHDMTVGGAFGRRGHREHEWLTDALLLSKAVKKPVKVIWTRQDDIRNGRFRAQTAHYMRAGLDAQGKIVAWHHRVVADQTMPFMDPVRFARANGRDGIIAGGADASVFGFPNRLAEVIGQDNGVRTSPWRGIGHGPNKYAVDVFLDDIARRRGMDAVAFRLELVAANARAQRVIRAVAKLADWGASQPGRSKGFTFVDYGAYLGAVAEVSVDRESGHVRVHRFWSVVDPGFAVQPDNVRAQIEGGIIFGLGSALSERITLKDGAVEQSNFNDYVLPRMLDLPEIHVEVLSSPDAEPRGIGEQSVVTVAPAISNAIAAAIGRRVNRLPMTPERVLAALQA